MIHSYTSSELYDQHPDFLNWSFMMFALSLSIVSDHSCDHPPIVMIFAI